MQAVTMLNFQYILLPPEFSSILDQWDNVTLLVVYSENKSNIHFVTKGSVILTFTTVQPCQITLEGIFTRSGFLVNSEQC